MVFPIEARFKFIPDPGDGSLIRFDASESTAIDGPAYFNGFQWSFYDDPHDPNVIFDKDQQVFPIHYFDDSERTINDPRGVYLTTSGSTQGQEMAWPKISFQYDDDKKKKVCLQVTRFYRGYRLDDVICQMVTPESGESTGPLDHPNGYLLIPARRDAGGTKILRLTEGHDIETIKELPDERGVHLMRHEGALFKGNNARQLARSEDEGKEWTVISNAFPDGYKTISWTATAPDGGFVALASKDKKLYVAASLSGRNWSAPKEIFGNGTRNVSRAQIKQMSASGESHLIVSDGTFAIRSDDYFKTAGTVLFS